MTKHTTGVPLGAWLADLPDDRLIRLLELRPDLTQPPPGSISALAARAQARQSVKAAADDLDFLRLAVLDALLTLHANVQPVAFPALVDLIGSRAEEPAVAAAVADLRDRALVWGDELLRVAVEASAGLPWYPGQVVLEDPSADPTDIAERIAQLDAPETELLHRLLEGSPIGRTRDAAPGTPGDRPVQRLLAAGLLRAVDEETVILPRQVAQVLRGDLAGPVRFSAPDPATGTAGAKGAHDADATAAGAVIEILHQFEVVIEALGAAPIAELRNGGLGVRDLKRLAKTTGIDEGRLGLILEIASAAGLIHSGIPDPEPQDGPAGAGPYWAPTVAADRFAEAAREQRLRRQCRAEGFTDHSPEFYDRMVELRAQESEHHG